jgi:hypothetical protein
MSIFFSTRSELPILIREEQYFSKVFLIIKEKISIKKFRNQKEFIAHFSFFKFLFVKVLV